MPRRGLVLGCVFLVGGATLQVMICSQTWQRSDTEKVCQRGDNRAPSFLISATREPDGANLDRVQVVKGWRDKKGGLHEKVYDVAWSDNREADIDGRLPPAGSTVNLNDASYLNSIGSPSFSVTWIYTDFERDEAAFYYVRVLQIPTPRWTTYDAVLYGLGELPSPEVIQERAYTSPIWYTP